MTTDATHDPKLRSWLASANAADTDFPIQNLPFGVCRTGHGIARCVAIGDRVLPLAALHQAGLLPKQLDRAGERATSLNGLLAEGRGFARELRTTLVGLLSDKAARPRVEPLLVDAGEAELLLPVVIGDYTDFYASVHHATNVGSMFRPDNPLLPNYKYIPIGYHGRSSSIVVSGTPVRRPMGQVRDDAAAAPTFGPTRRLDYELEVGAYVATGNALGERLGVDAAEEQLWGVTLLNDWSARDIQAWEYQPLGPFLAKNFATTVSPWVVSMEALEPYRVPLPARVAEDPAPLPHLRGERDAARGGIALVLEVWLRSAQMRERGLSAVRVSRGSFTDMYWTFAQMLAHHASNGCNLRPGDLIGSGTVSGATKESRGCMLERAWRGQEPIELPTGETRAFLQDGDEVTLRGYPEREGYRRIGLGACAGIITPALP